MWEPQEKIWAGVLEMPGTICGPSTPLYPLIISDTEDSLLILALSCQGEWKKLRDKYCHRVSIFVIVAVKKWWPSSQSVPSVVFRSAHFTWSILFPCLCNIKLKGRELQVIRSSVYNLINLTWPEPAGLLDFVPWQFCKKDQWFIICTFCCYTPSITMHTHTETLNACTHTHIWI